MRYKVLIYKSWLNAIYNSLWVTPHSDANIKFANYVHVITITTSVEAKFAKGVLIVFFFWNKIEKLELMI